MPFEMHVIVKLQIYYQSPFWSWVRKKHSRSTSTFNVFLFSMVTVFLFPNYHDYEYGKGKTAATLNKVALYIGIEWLWEWTYIAEEQFLLCLVVGALAPRFASTGHQHQLYGIYDTGLILGLHPTNERRRYKVTPSLIGWAQTQNQPCDIKETFLYEEIFQLTGVTLLFEKWQKC